MTALDALPDRVLACLAEAGHPPAFTHRCDPHRQRCEVTGCTDLGFLVGDRPFAEQPDAYVEAGWPQDDAPDPDTVAKAHTLADTGTAEHLGLLTELTGRHVIGLVWRLDDNQWRLTRTRSVGPRNYPGRHRRV